MIFPNLRKYRKVTGSNFQSDDSGASLYNIDAYTESSEGVKLMFNWLLKRLNMIMYSILNLKHQKF